jgi:hypothetical protein
MRAKRVYRRYRYYSACVRARYGFNSGMMRWTSADKSLTALVFIAATANQTFSDAHRL